MSIYKFLLIFIKYRTIGLSLASRPTGIILDSNLTISHISHPLLICVHYKWPKGRQTIE